MATLQLNQCVHGKYLHWISERFEDTPDSPIYMSNITGETLEQAMNIYFQIAYCSDFDYENIQFYRRLFNNFPFETILKTIVRILSAATERQLTEHFDVAKGSL